MTIASPMVFGSLLDSAFERGDEVFSVPLAPWGPRTPRGGTLRTPDFGLSGSWYLGPWLSHLLLFHAHL